MTNYMEEAFAPIEAANRAIVMGNTWGHLAPEPGHKYYGSLTFAHTEWGETVAICDRFPDLDDSPWLFEDRAEWLGQQARRDDIEDGHIYRFDGYYQKFKNGNFRFVGKVTEVIV